MTRSSPKISIAGVDAGPSGAGDPGILAALTAREPERLLEARDRLIRLGAAAAGSDETFARYHATMYALHERRDMATATRRAWLAAEAYPGDESRVADCDWPHALPLDEFHAHVDGLLSMRGRLGSEMSEYLFSGKQVPAWGAARLYILHHWYRSRRFYELVGTFAMRTPLDDVAPLNENLAVETGALPGTRPHPRMLDDLLTYFGLPESGQDHPAMPIAWAYINNRHRCVRTVHPAWGLALLYSLEFTTTETHTNVHNMLERVGAPPDARAFHALHMVSDTEHAAGIWHAGRLAVADLEGQRIFLRSLAEQQRLSRAYFGAIWQTIQQTVLAAG
jgi:heme oxygenase-like protein